MEVIAIAKSALDGMKNELRELLEMTETATRKYTPIFKKKNGSITRSVFDDNITKRTLQTYKDKGLLPYSKSDPRTIINSRMYRLC